MNYRVGPESKGTGRWPRRSPRLIDSIRKPLFNRSRASDDTKDEREKETAEKQISLTGHKTFWSETQAPTFLSLSSEGPSTLFQVS